MFCAVAESAVNTLNPMITHTSTRARPNRSARAPPNMPPIAEATRLIVEIVPPAPTLIPRVGRIAPRASGNIVWSKPSRPQPIADAVTARR